jgi:hypothetical protein
MEEEQIEIGILLEQREDPGTDSPTNPEVVERFALNLRGTEASAEARKHRNQGPVGPTFRDERKAHQRSSAALAVSGFDAIIPT